MRYTKPKDGEWIQPQRRAYKLMCCDCGLVHNLDFRVVHSGRGCTVQFRAYRNNRSTAMTRRIMSDKAHWVICPKCGKRFDDSREPDCCDRCTTCCECQPIEDSASAAHLHKVER